MNNVCLIGNLTKDIELKVTPTQKYVTTFTVAVYRDKEHTDFINCVAWGKTAENMSVYCRKGSKIGITGSIQTRNYDDNSGKRVYVTEIVVRDVQFLSSNANTQAQVQTPQQEPENSLEEEFKDYMTPALDISSDDLPF